MDAQVPGLGVRVTGRVGKKGRAAQKTFILVARYPGSKLNKRGKVDPTRRALGEYGELTLVEARDKARAWLALIRRGVDPRAEETRLRAIEQAKRTNSFAAVAEDYFNGPLSKQRRAKVSEREIRRELVARWGTRPITEVTADDVVGMASAIKARGSTRQALNVYGLARTFFSWAATPGQPYGLSRSPCDGLRSKQLIGEKVQRERSLTDPEIRLVWHAAGELRYPYGPLYQLLMLTGQRKAEVGEARWHEFDVPAALWTIPPERFKSGKLHIVPLSAHAIALLSELPRFRTSGFLFSTNGGVSAVNGYSKARTRLDAAIARGGRAIEEPWVIHDVRRTVRSQLAALRVPDHVAELVIGHARKGIAGTYDRHKYLDERREALELWAARLHAILASEDALRPVCNAKT